MPSADVYLLGNQPHNPPDIVVQTSSVPQTTTNTGGQRTTTFTRPRLTTGRSRHRLAFTTHPTRLLVAAATTHQAAAPTFTATAAVTTSVDAVVAVRTHHTVTAHAAQPLAFGAVGVGETDDDEAALILTL